MRMQGWVCIGLWVAGAAGCSYVDPTGEEFTIQTPDGITLRGAILPAKRETGPLGGPPVTVVYSHPWLMTRDFGASMIEEIRERGWQVVVYDQRDDRAHVLNAATVAVWRQCDGKTPLAASETLNISSGTSGTTTPGASGMPGV